MENNVFSEQIKNRRIFDQNVYNQSLNDLLSVLKVKGVFYKKQVKDAIEEILRYLGEEIIELPEDTSQLNSQLEYMLKPSSTMKRRVELTGDWWKNSFGCLLASRKNGEIIALFQNEWGRYYYTDSNGKTIKINKLTAEDINIDAFCFYKSFLLIPLKIKDLIIFMLKNISKLDIFLIFIICFFVQILGMLSPYITKIIYDQIVPSASLNFVLPTLFLMLGISLNTSIVSVAKNLIISRIKLKLNLAVNSAIMIRMFSLPATFFKKYSSGELASRVGYLASFCQMISEMTISTLLTSLFSIGYFFQMWKFAPSMVTPGILIMFSSIIFSTFITFLKQKLNKRKMKFSSSLNSLVFALFNGIQKIKITGSEKRAFANWAKIYSKTQKINFSPPMFIRISSVITTLINSLGNLIFYYFAATNNVSASDYLAFGIAYGAVSGAVMSISDVLVQFANLKPVLDLIKSFIQEQPENTYGKKLVTSLSGNIEINNILFKYSEDAPYVLKNLSLKIKSGEYIAIVGQTGCGKSTILRLLLGFEKPQSGAIYYNNQDINSLDMTFLRQKIGVVMQNGSIFPGDIFSNIIVASPWATMEDAWEAAEIANIDEDIRNMPMEMHTLISEGSGGISGGQKQRLMIARAIISKPSILFLDEATSALDNITQKNISESLSRFKCTRLVIAHRLSTVKNCDRIIVLDKGQVIEDGNFDELMSKKGKFYELAIRQINT
ncbi:MAG: NHLP family bacteriocin export ABC transporter permease/ATPase subunit [Candidatus Improbicoccus pseudotrichonymphae]|uniref:NHLP family bacteriocin export ABC transporter permease/ATPase subunit n=1 Tax=Candidatus Improbicoccus pseudotrichonymphae TaxID=3033792 RepID=A0AA48I858_9FIRM|nr:MAG: NHLP family bacteriocin export ABC transporter permease/ATPase subunit [Candidatus Improbicoccus pseudotrichonymphae]